MQLSRTLFSSIIIFIIAASLISLAYPSIVVSNYSIENLTRTSIQISTNTNVYVYTFYTWPQYSTTVVSYYWPLGSSGGCWGSGNYPGGGCYYQPIATTATYQTSTEITTTYSSTNQLVSTSQQMYTIQLLQVSSQNVPPYAAMGLSDSQFSLVAILILVAGGVAMFYSRKGHTRSRQTRLQQFVSVKTFCVECGSEIPQKSKFCHKCGTQQP